MAFRSTGNRLNRMASAKGATFLLPTPGQVSGGSKSGGVRYQWQGQKAIPIMNDILLRGFQRMARAAEEYWRNTEWTEANHPEMTGNERDLGFFRVSEANNRVVFVGGTRAPYAAFEEFGTRYREGHFPVRKTLDRVVYRASYYIRAAAKA